MKWWTGFADSMKNITMFTQFGLSLVIPLLVCIGICWWLTARMGVGGWVYIPGFFFGLGGLAMTMYKFYLSIVGRQKKEKKKDKISFNQHQ